MKLLYNRKYNYRKLFSMLLIVVPVLMLSACKDQWAAHNEIVNAENNLTLTDKISQQPNLSRFAELLSRTGYDKVLASSKTFTVWAPTNEAMAKIPQAALATDSLARQFAANHIVNQNYLVAGLKTAGLTEQRVQTLNGKYLTFRPETVDEAGIVKADQVVKNGVLHEINGVIEVRKSVWEYLNNLSGVSAQQQVNFLKGLNYSIAGTSKVYSSTGTRNDYLEQVAALNNESGQFTYILLTDDAYNREYSKLLKYFQVSRTDARYDSTTVYRTALQVTKDLVAGTIVTPTQLGATLLSTTAVNIPIDKSAIVASYRASNGMVYVMNKVDFNVFKDKIKPIVLEGEQLSTYSRTDRGGNIFTRIRLDENGIQFTDRFISGTGYAQFWARGRINNIYSSKYQVYWRALNDQAWSAATPPAPVNFRQKLGFSAPAGAALPYIDIIPYTTVAYNNPDDKTRLREQLKEVYLGDITVTSWGPNLLYVIGDNVTTAGLNTISIDYIKLVPIN